MTGRDLTEQARPRFVEGIGPPLSQIEEDYALDDSYTEARDAIALAAEIRRLDAALVQAEERITELEAELKRYELAPEYPISPEKNQ